MTTTFKVPAAKPPETVLLAKPPINVPVSKLMVLAKAPVGKAKAKSANHITRLILLLLATGF
jgi:hypothetical protein